jgi:alginate O-acetyltransferase complex protein AlgJ
MSAEPLTPEGVISVYRQVLGRHPQEAEIQHQLNTLPSLDAMLRVALDSDEYAARLTPEQRRPPTRRPSVVNVFHPDLAEWGHPAGRRSDDGDAIVGREGWLFLCGGTNANLGQYVGAVQMEPGWLDEWRDAIARRAAEIRSLGVDAALLIVPDKLAVYEAYYPEPLARVGPRPVERLLASGDLPITYPLAELREAVTRDEAVYLRTDTHLTFRGNELLFEAVRPALGVAAPLNLAGLAERRYVAPGDLGVKFDPAIVEVMASPGTLNGASIQEDNRDAIAAVGGHIGTRRVFVNDAAPDDRVAVIFGDSFGFAADNYQGLSWFLAQVFRETHFVWVPFGWDPDYVRAVEAKAVLIQGAERFVARVPRVSVEVAELEREALGPGQALGIESAFGGGP